MNSRPLFQRSADEVANLKAAMREAWNTPGAGYQEMADGFVPAVEHLLDFAQIGAGMRVLDVATGTGVAAIAAARRGATVAGIDFAPDLIEHARRMAQQTTVQIAFEVGDAEQLAFDDASFDAVISTFGCMFVPRPDAAAFEMSRVLKPGGTLALATWKPEEPNCSLMNITAPYLPARVQDLPSPLNWGREEYIKELLAPHLKNVRFAGGDAPWIVESPTEALDMLFRRCLGPTVYTYQQFDHKNKLAVRADAMALMRENQRPDGTVSLSRHYLLIVAERR